MKKQQQFYIKFVKKGRTYYVDGTRYKNGKGWRFVSKEKVLKSKKKVLNYDLKHHEIKEPKKAKKKEVKELIKSENLLIQSHILSMSLPKAVIIAIGHKKRIGVKYKSKIYEIDTSTAENTKNLLSVFDEIQRAYFNAMGQISDSPLLFISYAESPKALVIDYDDTILGEENEIADEFPKEYKSFKIKVGLILSNYLK